MILKEELALGERNDLSIFRRKTALNITDVILAAADAAV